MDNFGNWFLFLHPDSYLSVLIYLGRDTSMTQCPYFPFNLIIMGIDF